MAGMGIFMGTKNLHQLYKNVIGFMKNYPMQSKSETYEALNNSISSMRSIQMKPKNKWKPSSNKYIMRME
jgi:hypothetical protein